MGASDRTLTRSPFSTAIGPDWEAHDRANGHGAWYDDTNERAAAELETDEALADTWRAEDLARAVRS